MEPLDILQQRLDRIKGKRLYRQLRAIEDGAEAWAKVEGRRALNLSSNNYLGLATRKELREAAAQAAEEEGVGSGSARLIGGNTERAEELERQMAHFKGAESALLFGSGYAANVGVITALVGAGDVILSDELNHASIIDGCRLSRATCKVYPHGNVVELERLLEGVVQGGHEGVILVVTDSVFSMDGDLAPLREIVELCQRYRAFLLVDEAHATGCVGPGGRGLVEHLYIKYEGLISVCTFSKALGSLGACVVGPAVVREYLINVSRNFIFTTALPPPVIAASQAALELVERESSLVERLQENAIFLRRGLQQLGFDTLGSRTQIIPVLVGDASLTVEMARQLLHEGVFAVAIRPPTVPADSSRIRTSVMATHTRAELLYALDIFERVGRRVGVIK